MDMIRKEKIASSIKAWFMMKTCSPFKVDRKLKNNYEFYSQKEKAPLKKILKKFGHDSQWDKWLRYKTNIKIWVWFKEKNRSLITDCKWNKFMDIIHAKKRPLVVRQYPLCYHLRGQLKHHWMWKNIKLITEIVLHSE